MFAVRELSCLGEQPRISLSDQNEFVFIFQLQKVAVRNTHTNTALAIIQSFGGETLMSAPVSVYLLRLYLFRALFNQHGDRPLGAN